MEYSCIPLDITVFTRAIAACGKANEPLKALGLLSELKENLTLPPPPHSLPPSASSVSWNTLPFP